MPIHENGQEGKKYYALQPLAMGGTPQSKFEALYEEAGQAHPALHKITRDITGKFGGHVLMAPLKLHDVAWAKLSRGDANKAIADGDIAKLNDIVRATVKFTTFAALLKAQRYMEQAYEGIVYDRFKDGATESGYRDVKHVLKVPVHVKNRRTHHICELQFHTMQTRNAYEVFHPIYDVLRRMGKEGAAQPLIIPAEESANLGGKLRKTWSTMLIRHIGGQALVHQLYDIVRLFYADSTLETLRKGPVDLSKQDVERLIEMGPVIHDAYYRNMMNAQVMVDGKLQPVVNGQARNAIYSKQQVAARKAEQEKFPPSKVYI